ncbi:hypothetical protein ERD78_11745 [Allopusillimonas soli]|uniref:Uncharacterized protein n=1 Tax=Allopusillimonas soli TaxID=659016 RepID=A0A853F9L3_9BURK|nr:hypothetical protein [Allopusillimonas soli]NYT37374.1 hypothetical protein [Allopusillimonas soli]TEA74644.1 hypothetical protein ERD78_11745 [Allopusillimonas soli]
MAAAEYPSYKSLVTRRPYVDAEGRIWKPHEIVWHGVDVTFGTTIMALSEEHARLLLDDMKATGRIEGEIIASYQT